MAAFTMYHISGIDVLTLVLLLTACGKETLQSQVAMTALPSQTMSTQSTPLTGAAGLPTVTPTLQDDHGSTALPRRTRAAQATVVLTPPKPIAAITGLPHDRLFLGAYDLNNQLEQRPLDVQMDYFDWVKYDAIGQFIYRTAKQRRIPVVSLEPWTTASGQQANVLHDTTDGLNDGIIRTVAKTVKASTDQQVLVRWAQEPELVGLYPWSLKNPLPYLDAFRRIHRIFAEEGVTNALWVWSPAGNVNCMNYYPGEAYVDMVGITVLENRNWDLQNGMTAGSSFEQLFGEKYHNVSTSGKPVVIAEFGVSGPRAFQSTWLKDAFATMARSYPKLHGVIYFDAVNAPNGWTGDRPNWQVDPSLLPSPAEMPKIKK